MKGISGLSGLLAVFVWGRGLAQGCWAVGHTERVMVAVHQAQQRLSTWQASTVGTPPASAPPTTGDPTTGRPPHWGMDHCPPAYTSAPKRPSERVVRLPPT